MRAERLILQLSNKRNTHPIFAVVSQKRLIAVGSFIALGPEIIAEPCGVLQISLDVEIKERVKQNHPRNGLKDCFIFLKFGLLHKLPRPLKLFCNNFGMPSYSSYSLLRHPLNTPQWKCKLVAPGSSPLLVVVRLLWWDPIVLFCPAHQLPPALEVIRQIPLRKGKFVSPSYL